MFHISKIQGLLHTDDDTEDGDEAAPVQAIMGHSIVKHTRPTLATFILDLLSVLTKGSIEESLSAARYLVKVVQVVDKEQIKEQLKEIVMELKKVRIISIKYFSQEVFLGI